MKLALVYGEAPKQVFVCLTAEQMARLLVRDAKFSPADAVCAVKALTNALDLAARQK